MTTLLELEDLSVSFGRRQAVRKLGFSVGAGETLALVGESGSGKSVTALSIMRLIEREGGAITGGRIRLHDGGTRDLTALGDRDMQDLRGNTISMIFQEPMTSLNPVLTIGDQLSEVFIRHQRLDRGTAMEASQAALARVRIGDADRRIAQYPHELSGGLRQRVMIAMALACRPRLLIADEPTTALDVTTQGEILALIRDLQAEIGMSVLFITHDMGVVAEMSDRVVVLRDGEKMEEAAVGDLFHRPKAAYSRQLIAATPRLGSGAPPEPAPSAQVLEVSDLVTRFPVRRGLLRRVAAHVHAVEHVSLGVRAGETLGLVGESGCGKSTLARSILRLIPSQSGEIRICGENVVGLSERALRPLRRRAQMIFQDPFASLNPRLPAYDLVTEPAVIHGMVSSRERRDLAVELVEKVGLEADAVDRYAHQFSGGQRQRLCIARALSVEPSLIVADEPVSALDVSIARQVIDLMQELQRSRGLAFLFISHDMAVVERISHRIAVMYAGEIVETGPTDRILSAPQHVYTQRLLSSVPMPDPDRRRGLRIGSAQEPPSLVRPLGAPPRQAPLTERAPGHFVRADAA